MFVPGAISPAGDTVSNMDLRPILAAHRERAERDKDAIMTLVRQCSSSSSLAAVAAAAVVLPLGTLLAHSSSSLRPPCMQQQQQLQQLQYLIGAGDVTLDESTACRDGNLDASLSCCLYLLLPLASLPCR
jgi:hypothetical protein